MSLLKKKLSSVCRHGAYKLLLFLHQSQYLGRVLIAALSPLKVVVCSFLHGQRVVPLRAFSCVRYWTVPQVCAESIQAYHAHREMETKNTAALDRAQIPTVHIVSERHVENAVGEIPHVVLLRNSLSLLVLNFCYSCTKSGVVHH